MKHQIDQNLQNQRSGKANKVSESNEVEQTNHSKFIQ